MTKDVRYDFSTIALWIIILLSLAVRLWGISFGLPHLYHADEPLVVNHSLAFGSGDFNPHYFKIPPLINYFLFFCYGLFFLLGRSTGTFKNVEDFQNLFLSDPSSFYLIGRVILGALCGTLTVYLIYKLINKLFTKEHALLSCLLFGLNFLQVRDSHFIYLDIPLQMVTILCFFYIFKILTHKERLNYVIFGILLGIAVGIKYNGFFIIVPLLIAHILRSGFKLSSILNLNLILVGIFSAISFLVVNPFALIDFQSFHRDLFGMSEFETFMGFSHHFIYSLSGALGFPLLFLGLIGMISGLIQRNQKILILASYTISYYFVLCFFSQSSDRYVLPLIPWMLFFAADVLVALRQKLNYSYVTQCILVILLLTPSLLKTVLCNQLLSRPDVRSMSLEWVEKNIPENSRIALDLPFFMPRLLPNLKQLEEKNADLVGTNNQMQTKRLDWMIENAKKNNPAKKRYELFFLSKHPEGDAFLFAKPVLPYQIEKIKRNNIEYVIMTRLRPHLYESNYHDFYENVKSASQLIARFSPYKDKSRTWAIDDFPLTGAPFLWKELVGRERNGHIIEIYRIRAANIIDASGKSTPLEAGKRVDFRSNN